MPFSNHDREQLLALFDAEEGRQDTQLLLKRAGRLLGNDGFITELILTTWQERLMSEIAKGQEAWFTALGWWLARVLIWTSLATGLFGVYFWGAPAADALTWALLGATGYYIVIQVLTPLRLKKERRHLEAALAARREAIAEILRQERAKSSSLRP